MNVRAWLCSACPGTRGAVRHPPAGHKAANLKQTRATTKFKWDSSFAYQIYYLCTVPGGRSMYNHSWWPVIPARDGYICSSHSSLLASRVRPPAFSKQWAELAAMHTHSSAIDFQICSSYSRMAALLQSTRPSRCGRAQCGMPTPTVD